MSIPISHRIRLQYEGGTADRHEIDFYDGTTSIHGFAQALQIATHAYLNGEIVSRATALRGARLYLRTLKKGSLVFEVIALIEQYPAMTTIAASVAGPAFFEFLKIALRKASGLRVDQPKTKYVRDLMERDEPFFDELAEMLEGSLQRAHRPIGDSVSGVRLGSPRMDIVNFDQNTKDWVNTREENPTVDLVHGNVTRFNSITRNGRLYVHELGKIVPFRPDGDFPSASLGLLTWSLHGSNTSLPKRLELKVRHVKSARGETKRLLLSECRRIAEDT